MTSPDLKRFFWLDILKSGWFGLRGVGPTYVLCPLPKKSWQVEIHVGQVEAPNESGPKTPKPNPKPP